MLVREQLDEDRRRQSVVWELEASKDRAGPRVIRRSQPGEKGFLSSGLTPDGRYYWWVGPREPKNNWRVEVLEVATGKLKEKRNLTMSDGSEPGAYLSPDGRYLWITDDERSLRDLSDDSRPGRRVSDLVLAVSPDCRWLLYFLPQKPVLTLKRWDEERPWLVLEDSVSGTCSSFSPDNRYLAIGKRSGHVTVIDLPALQQEIAEFEKTLPK